MPEGLSAEGVFEAAAAGDPGAVETLEEIGTLTAYALQFVALAYDPQIIVIGGSVMLGSPRLFRNTQRKLHELADSSWVFGKIYSEGLITLSTLGNEAGVLGAAALAVPEPSGARALVSREL
jgi:glucokinase